MNFALVILAFVAANMLVIDEVFAASPNNLLTALAVLQTEVRKARRILRLE